MKPAPPVTRIRTVSDSSGFKCWRWMQPRLAVEDRRCAPPSIRGRAAARGGGAGGRGAVPRGRDHGRGSAHDRRRAAPVEQQVRRHRCSRHRRALVRRLRDHLGDLAISWPMTVRQAVEHGHAPRRSSRLLCVHGLLHLSGWDHASARERKEMTRLTLRPSRCPACSRRQAGFELRVNSMHGLRRSPRALLRLFCMGNEQKSV